MGPRRTGRRCFAGSARAREGAGVPRVAAAVPGGEGDLRGRASPGRESRRLGHEGRPIASICAKTIAKRQKSDARDAAAIADAAQRPTMRFVAVKAEEAQARAMGYRTRAPLMGQRTQPVNAVHGHPRRGHGGASRPVGRVSPPVEKLNPVHARDPHQLGGLPRGQLRVQGRQRNASSVRHLVQDLPDQALRRRRDVYRLGAETRGYRPRPAEQRVEGPACPVCEFHIPTGRNAARGGDPGSSRHSSRLRVSGGEQAIGAASATGATDDSRTAMDALAARADWNAESRKIAIPADGVHPVDAEAVHDPPGECAVLRSCPVAMLRCSRVGTVRRRSRCAEGARRESPQAPCPIAASRDTTMGTPRQSWYFRGADRRSSERSSREEAPLSAHAATGRTA